MPRTRRQVGNTPSSTRTRTTRRVTTPQTVITQGIRRNRPNYDEPPEYISRVRGPQPLQLPEMQTVDENSTLEELLDDPLLVFHYNPETILSDEENSPNFILNVTTTSETKQKIRDEVSLHPEKREEIRNLLLKYIDDIINCIRFEIQYKNAILEYKRIKLETRIYYNTNVYREDTSRRSEALRSKAVDLEFRAYLLNCEARKKCKVSEFTLLVFVYGSEQELRDLILDRYIYFHNEDDDDSPLPAQRVPDLPAIPQGFQPSELPNINVDTQCNGETYSPISMDPLENGKTVILSDGKCYSFDDIANLYRNSHRRFISPLTREPFTEKDINIARTIFLRKEKEKKSTCNIQ